VSCSWTPSPEFERQRKSIFDDDERWDALMRFIEDDLMLHPERMPLVEGTPFRMLQTRPGAAGFPGLTILFSIEPGGKVCVLEGIKLSDDQTPVPLLSNPWGWAQSNGNH
jgi:hypothetical protein